MEYLYLKDIEQLDEVKDNDLYEKLKAEIDEIIKLSMKTAITTDEAEKMIIKTTARILGEKHRRESEQE